MNVSGGTSIAAFRLLGAPNGVSQAGAVTGAIAAWIESESRLGKEECHELIGSPNEGGCFGDGCFDGVGSSRAGPR